MTCILLHSSGCSSVFLGTCGSNDTEPLSCFKVYSKEPLQSRHWLNINRECSILCRLKDERVDGIVQLLSVADTAKHFSLQFRPCLGGNLYHTLERRECCDEAQLCVKVVIPLLRVLQGLHSRGIIHRDIKPENIFFEADGKLVLGDFGLAIDSTKDKPCSRVGTQDYMAPEVLAQPSADTVALRNIPSSMLIPYGAAVDIWALGTLIHEALTGKLPFYHAEPAVMTLKVQFGRANRLPQGTSSECQAFVDAVLQKQPDKRPTAAELLNHPWVERHQAAAAAAVAARIKAKVLAHLQLDRPTLESTASRPQTSPVAPVLPPISSRRNMISSAAAAASDTDPALSSSTLSAAAAAACANIGSAGDASACSSSLSSQLDRAVSGSTCSSSAGRMDRLSCRHLQSAAGNTAAKAAAYAACPMLPAKPPGSCRPHKVSVDCDVGPQLLQEEDHDEDGKAGSMPAVVVGTPVPASATQHATQQQLAGSSSSSRVISAPPHHCHSAPEAHSNNTQAEGMLFQKLQLVPALSDPVVMDVQGDAWQSATLGGLEGAQCCCCRSRSPSGRRSSQSGTCISTIAGAVAGMMQLTPHSWSATATATITTTSVAAANSCKRSADSQQGPAGDAGCRHFNAARELAGTTQLQKALSTGHEPVSCLSSVPTATTTRDVRRVVQLAAGTCSSSSTSVAGPLAPAAGGGGGASVLPPAAAAAGPQQCVQHKALVLKASSLPTPAAAAVLVGGAVSCQPPLLLSHSPPKPAMLVQRLRSLASKDHSSSAIAALSNTARGGWKRRHSFDLMPSHPAASSVASASAVGTACSSGSSSEGGGDGGVDTAGGMSVPCSDLPSPPQRCKAKPAGAPGLASPLAALSKLLSPAKALTAGSVNVNSAINSTAPCCSQGTSHSHAMVKRQVGKASKQEAGTAALLVGLAGTASSAAGARIASAWADKNTSNNQSRHSSDLISPTSGSCRSAKGVCLKVLNQVLRHQQQA